MTSPVPTVCTQNAFCPSVATVTLASTGAGGRVKGEISTGTVSEGLKPVYVHRQWRTLSKILAELLRASNNYVANQVFLEIGAHRLGGPVSLEKSLKVANEMLAAPVHRLEAAK
jgi:D-alanyl-D-alanine carboxypeptidase